MFYATTHCDNCGKSLKVFEAGVCQECTKKVLNPNNNFKGDIEKQLVVETLNSCYIDKQELREIIENYSIRKKDGSLFFDYKYAPDFVNEILELAGYRVQRRKR